MAVADFLDQMAAASRVRADQLTSDRVGALDELARDAPGPISLPPPNHEFHLIAEAKLRSPGSGRLLPPGDDTQAVTSLAKAFEQGGAAAISILTEPCSFDGSLAHLKAVSQAVSVPVMRKDFLVDPAQVVESRAYGASGVLLIARILGGGQMARMMDEVRKLGMFALVELFGPEDLEVVASIVGGIDLLGVNTRDLTDLSVQADRLETMATLLPAGIPWVAESGLLGPEDAATVAAIGYRYALVGTGLVTQSGPSTALREMLAAGRSIAGPGP